MSDSLLLDPTAPAGLDLFSLVDRMLCEQQQLTAVERFSQFHTAQQRPLQERYYSALLPAAPPGKGEQFAFEVDLDACSGCKACVTACHNLNGLDEHESWRDVGLLHGGSAELPVLQHATSACHHCLEPACLSACPVRAYEKDPATGIVRHLDDQCIGCQYCMLACPYDVPKYNKAKGIVRKCDMCSSRLSAGEAPACVQACPNSAIRITVVRQQEVVENCETNQFLPGAPEPRYTLPTTNYKSRRPLARNLLPADYFAVHPEHAHWSLIVMLVLTQLSVGVFVFERLVQLARNDALLAAVRPVLAVGALWFGTLALGASVFHLGRPRFAFRALLGLKTSWLSREILAFGLFAGAAAAYAASVGFGPAEARGLNAARQVLGFAVTGFGLAGILSSVMVYGCTRRAYWAATPTAARFLLTTLILGGVTVLLTCTTAEVWLDSAAARQIISAYGTVLCQGLAVVTAAKLLFEAGIFRHLRDKRHTSLKRTAMLLSGELAGRAKARYLCGIAGGIVLPCFVLASVTQAEVSRPLVGLAACAAFVLSLAGELLERYLFFTAVAPSRMPGGLTS